MLRVLWADGCRWPTRRGNAACRWSRADGWKLKSDLGIPSFRSDFFPRSRPHFIFCPRAPVRPSQANETEFVVLDPTPDLTPPQGLVSVGEVRDDVHAMSSTWHFVSPRVYLHLLI